MLSLLQTKKELPLMPCTKSYQHASFGGELDLNCRPAKDKIKVTSEAEANVIAKDLPYFGWWAPSKFTPGCQMLKLTFVWNPLEFLSSPDSCWGHRPRNRLRSAGNRDVPGGVPPEVKLARLLPPIYPVEVAFNSTRNLHFNHSTAAICHYGHVLWFHRRISSRFKME